MTDDERREGLRRHDELEAWREGERLGRRAAEARDRIRQGVATEADLELAQRLGERFDAVADQAERDAGISCDARARMIRMKNVATNNLTRKTMGSDPGEADAVIRVRRWAQTIGGGFHPDTAAEDYKPSLREPERYDRDMRIACRILGNRIYDVAMSAGRHR